MTTLRRAVPILFCLALFAPADAGLFSFVSARRGLAEQKDEPALAEGKLDFVDEQSPESDIARIAQELNISDPPSLVPSDLPSLVPSDAPSLIPSGLTSDAPSMIPTEVPSPSPSVFSPSPTRDAVLIRTPGPSSPPMVAANSVESGGVRNFDFASTLGVSLCSVIAVYFL
jgi:hypothetical protein